MLHRTAPAVSPFTMTMITRIRLGLSNALPFSGGDAAELVSRCYTNVPAASPSVERLVRRRTVRRRPSTAPTTVRVALPFVPLTIRRC